jgi:hypothetical protein
VAVLIATLAAEERKAGDQFGMKRRPPAEARPTGKSPQIKQPDPMNKSNQFQPLACLLATACVATVWITPPARLQAQEQNAAVQQRLFASPEEAVKTMLDAAKAGDKAALHEIFGPDIHGLLTGDEVQDKANFDGFSRAMGQACVAEPEGADRVILDIGTNNWPFPIPLVKKDGQWFFDTDAGREEIINRQIGRDELNAIGVCRAYVAAQRQYFSKDRDGSGVPKYALKFKSTPGKQDGLYWKSTDEPSPFGALVAEAHSEGYGHDKKSEGPHPFHGYLFRILTSQGRAAPGGKSSYIVQGNLTAGFALVAYPEQWGKSGIMTFIVNQEGKVYQRNLGEKTTKAAGMTRYNPDANWTLVPEPGVTEP